jgi:hypothetical protein
MVEQVLQFMCAAALIMFAQMPSSTNYRINNYGFGSGGGSASSANYGLNAITGETSGQPATSTNYKVNSGNQSSQQADVPLAPTLTNPSNYYSRLHIVVNPDNNPSDATFAIAISTDNFTTTQYVQNDGTVGLTLGLEDYQTYAAWGGGTGSDIIGLSHSTAYQAKVKAMHGRFTETGYGDSASASTSPPSLAFDIDIASTDTETAPPYQIDFGNLFPNSVTNSPQLVWVDIDTNAEYGGRIYISGESGGLESNAASHTIASATADLSSASEGFGGQSASATQTSGGPLVSSNPYNGGAANVGEISPLARELYSSSGPVFNGRASLALKIKSTNMTPAADDYREILTIIASASF